VIGHYVLASAREPPFTDEERALLIAIGQQAGTVFARLQAEADARTQAEHTALLNKIIRRSNTTTAAQGFLQYVCDLLVEECGYDAVGLRIITDKDDIGQQVAAKGYSAEFNKQFRFMSIDDPILRGVYRGEPYFPSRYAKTHVDLVHATHVASNGIVPLAVGETIIGDMGLALKDYRPFSLDEQALLVSIGRETGTVLARLQAEQKVRAHAMHLEDVVKRRTAELARSEKQYRTLVETANSCILAMNADGIITYINDYGAQFFGYSPGELIGEDYMILVPKVDSSGKTLEPRIRDIIAHPDDYATNVNENVTKDGRLVWVQWVNRSLTDDEGRHIGHLAVGIDITELKHAERALQESERLAGIGQTAAMIGHDLRNPLQGLQYIVDLQKLRFERIPPEERTKQDWENEAQLFNHISEQVFYMNKIVEDLQDYARPIAPEREAVPVSALINGAIASVPHDDRVEIITDACDLEVNIDPHLMHRVLANLILNALQAMPQGGTLAVTASVSHHAVEIRVQDTGAGIPEELKGKLFSPLITGKAKGTGLGLAVVKRIVDAHGGKIAFESKVGKGTTFTLRLPLSW